MVTPITLEVKLKVIPVEVIALTLTHVILIVIPGEVVVADEHRSLTFDLAEFEDVDGGTIAQVGTMGAGLSLGDVARYLTVSEGVALLALVLCRAGGQCLLRCVLHVEYVFNIYIYWKST